MGHGPYVVGGNVQEQLDRITVSIRNRFNEMSSLVGEDPKIEYLFLAAAVERGPFRLEWHRLRFSSFNTPTGARFK